MATKHPIPIKLAALIVVAFFLHHSYHDICPLVIAIDKFVVRLEQILKLTLRPNIILSGFLKFF